MNTDCEPGNDSDEKLAVFIEYAFRRRGVTMHPKKLQGQIERLADELEEPEERVAKIAIPIAKKISKEVLKNIQEKYSKPVKQ